MALSPRVTTRRTAASRRFHAAPRSNPVAWIIGGIAAAFAVILLFVLFGGAPTDDGLPARVEILEAQAAKAASEFRPDEAIRIYEELLRIAAGERWVLKGPEWRGLIRDLKEEKALIREGTAKLAAWAAAVEAAGPAEARPLLEEGHRLQESCRRLWRHDAHMERLRKLLPKGPSGWQEEKARIDAEHKLERRGEARWSLALRDWKAYLAQELSATDRTGAGGAVATLQIRAREEAVSLVNKGSPTEELQRNHPRFLGTEAAGILEKAIGGR